MCRLDRCSTFVLPLPLPMSQFWAACSGQKDDWLLMCRQDAEKKVPAEWERLAQRRGFSRYMSPALRKLTTRRASLLQDRELALSGVLKVSPPPSGALHVAANPCSNAQGTDTQNLSGSTQTAGCCAEEASWQDQHTLVVKQISQRQERFCREPGRELAVVCA